MTTASLLKATLAGTSFLSRGSIKLLKKKKQLWVLVLAITGVTVAVGFMLLVLIQVYSNLVYFGTEIGKAEIVFFYALLPSWIIIFATEIPIAISILYFSKDTKMLIPLPISAFKIIKAKTMLIYLYALPVNLLFLLPAIIIYVLKTGFSLEIFIGIINILLLSPLLPLSLSILFVVMLIKLINLSRFRMLFEIGGMILAILLIIAFQVFIQTTLFNIQTEEANIFFTQLYNIYDTIFKMIPPLAWAASGFIKNQGLLYSLFSMVCSSFIIILTIFIARNSFIKDISEYATTSGKEIQLIKYNRKLNKQGIKWTLIKREWSILTSNSTFIVEAFGELLILPLLLVIYGLIMPREIIDQALNFLYGSPFAGLIIFTVIIFMTSFNTISSTSISREGKEFAISLMVPVRAKIQVISKLLFHILLFSSAYLLDIIIAYVIFRFPLNSLLYMIPGGIIFQIFTFCIDIFLDLKRPLLDWTHPQQAMKQNMNVLAAMGVTAVSYLFFGLGGFLLLILGTSPLITAGIVVFLVGIIDIPLLLSILKYAEIRYWEELEI